MRVSYSPGYAVPLPDGHPFPMSKFPALHRILLDDGLVRPEDVVEPWEADWRDLRLVHSADYLGALADGTLDRAAERRLGLAWSRPLLRRSRTAAQGPLIPAQPPHSHHLTA